MADILIRGMEMPRRREEVFLFAVDSDGKVYGWDSEELPRLKAIAIPPHGRLIDADKLEKAEEWRKHGIINQETVNAAPTIIPASIEDFPSTDVAPVVRGKWERKPDP